jgi:hypothetical protein
VCVAARQLSAGSKPRQCGSSAMGAEQSSMTSGLLRHSVHACDICKKCTHVVAIAAFAAAAAAMAEHAVLH